MVGHIELIGDTINGQTSVGGNEGLNSVRYWGDNISNTEYLWDDFTTLDTTKWDTTGNASSDGTDVRIYRAAQSSTGATYSTITMKNFETSERTKVIFKCYTNSSSNAQIYSDLWKQGEHNHHVNAMYWAIKKDKR